MLEIIFKLSTLGQGKTLPNTTKFDSNEKQTTGRNIKITINVINLHGQHNIS